MFRDTSLLPRTPKHRSSPLSTALATCTYSKSFRGHQQLAPSLPTWLTIQYVPSLLFNTKGENFPCVLCTIKLHVTLFRLPIISSPQDFILTFEPRQSNPTLLSRNFFSFVILSARLTRGEDGCTLNSPSIRVSEIHEYMAQQQTL